ncbi:MAG: hypothetical protein HXY50_02055, partial [Ignavibacteriaceae bacterium]|nr:hypothetical protein [Ignavibacteriaceae bacterium]
NFKKHYGKELAELANEFEQELRSRYIFLENESNRAKYYFGRKSIFYKVCPRYVARRVKEAWDKYVEKDYKRAKIIFEEVLNVTDSYIPIVGIALCESKLKNLKTAIDLVSSRLNEFEHTANYFELEFLLADLLAENNRINEADSLYKLLIYQNPNRNLTSLAKFRHELIKTDSLIQPYLTSNEVRKYEILKSLNLEIYHYSSFPFLITLSDEAGIEYKDLLKIFTKPFVVNDYESSFALYKLSKYVCLKSNFELARKIAALSIRYSKDHDFNPILKHNFEKMDWLYKNKTMINDFTITSN